MAVPANKSLLPILWKAQFPVVTDTTLYIKRCSCGVGYLPQQWATLPLVGYQSIGRLDTELRDCIYCKSTLSLIIGRRFI